MTYLFDIILITNYENKQQNKQRLGLLVTEDEQEKMNLLELTGAPTHDCRLMAECTPSLAPVGFFTEVEAM